MSHLAKVERLFERALAMPPAERQSFLEREGGDASQEVLALLAVDTERHGTLFAAGHQGIELRIGGYRLISCLGEGGFGVVYLAERLAPPRMRVALKVIRAELASQTSVLGRFEQEREILARLASDNIARLFDAGVTDAGRPYFVMEYVPGSPITEYCDRHRLTIRERLELMIPVCEAVQHAHAKGVIHRDLTPRNILVTDVPLAADDRSRIQRVPKVIDFGIAKATHGPVTEQPVYSSRGQLLGSLEYMSPEQAEGRCDDLDHRTDVYGLGAVVFELLVGVPPIDVPSLRSRGEARMLQALREDERPLAMTRFAALGEAQTRIAESRGTSTPELARELRRNHLQRITARAMCVRPDERYGSALDLRDDLRNYLMDRPLDCMSGSWLYDLRRFSRRHRTPVAVSTGVGVAMAASLVIISGLYARAAEAERREAEARAQAEAINHVLLEPLMMASPAEQSPVVFPTLREYLLAAAGRAENDSASPPIVRAGVHHALGSAFGAIGEYELCHLHLGKALALRRAMHGPADLRIAETLAAIAMTFVRSDGVGDGDAALRAAEEAHRIRKQVLGEHDTLVARSRLDIEWVRAVKSGAGSFSMFDRSNLQLIAQACQCPLSVDELESMIPRVITQVEALWQSGQHESAVDLFLRTNRENCPALETPLFRSRMPNIALGIAQNLRFRTPHVGAALAAFAGATRWAHEVGTPTSPATILVRLQHCWFLVDLGRFQDASARLSELTRDCGSVLGPKHEHTRYARALDYTCAVAMGTPGDDAVDIAAADPTPDEFLNFCVIAAVAPPGHGREVYERFLPIAEALAQRAPDNPTYRSTLGIAQYRTGRLDQAIANLRGPGQLTGARRKPNPRDLAYLSMALARSGQAELADATLAELRNAVSRLKGLQDIEPHRFLRWAEQEIAEIRSASGVAP